MSGQNDISRRLTMFVFNYLTALHLCTRLFILDFCHKFHLFLWWKITYNLTYTHKRLFIHKVIQSFRKERFKKKIHKRSDIKTSWKLTEFHHPVIYINWKMIRFYNFSSRVTEHPNNLCIRHGTRQIFAKIQMKICINIFRLIFIVTVS